MKVLAPGRAAVIGFGLRGNTPRREAAAPASSHPAIATGARNARYPPFGAHPLAFMMPSRSVRDRTLWEGAALRTVARRPSDLSLEPSAGCRAVNHLGLTGSDPLQG